MNYVKHLNMFGTEVKEIPCIPGTGAPTSSTAGAVGCLYMNTTTGDMYKCTGVNSGVYTWVLAFVLTDADYDQIAAVVIERLGGEPIHGYIDENNNIVLKGNLAEDKYSVKYELDDGTTIDIGDLVLADEPAAPTITSISASKTTTSYTAGDTLNTNDITVTATYSDGSTKTITDFTVDSSEVQMGTAGNYNLVVSYGGVNTTISIKVEEKVVESTNFFKPTPVVYTTSEASQDVVFGGGRLGSDSGYRADSGNNSLLTNYIPVEKGDTVYLTNMTAKVKYSGAFSTLNSTKGAAIFSPDSENGIVDYINDHEIKITSDYPYIRFAGLPDSTVVKNSAGTTIDAKYDLTQIAIKIKHSDGTWA